VEAEEQAQEAVAGMVQVAAIAGQQAVLRQVVQVVQHHTAAKVVLVVVEPLIMAVVAVVVIQAVVEVFTAWAAVVLAR
jgi:type II secretory pathway component PulF